MADQRWGWIIDWIVLPLVVFLVLYNPSHVDGPVGMFEAGQYLGSINAIFHGMVPYRDTFVLYGPLSVYLPALIMKLGTPTLETLRIYFHVCSIVTIIISCLLAVRVLATRRFALLACLCLILETYEVVWSNRWGALRQGMGLLVLLLLFAAEDEKKAGKCLFSAGLLCGLSLLYSTEIGAFGAVASIVFIGARACVHGPDLTLFKRFFVAYSAGAAACLVPFALYFAYENALWEYLRITFIDIPLHHFGKFGQPMAEVSFPWKGDLIGWFRWVRGIKVWLPAVTYVFAIMYVCWMSVTKRTLNRTGLRILTLAVYGIPLYLTAFRATKGPQFTSSLAPSILIGMVFLEWLWLYARDKGKAVATLKPALSRAWKTAAWITVFGCLLCYLVLNRNFAGIVRTVVTKAPTPVSTVLAPILEREAQTGETAIPNVPRVGHVELPKQLAEEIEDTVNYVASRTSAGEPILIFPDMGSYYFFLDRPSLTRFPVTVTSYMSEEYVAELMRAVKANPPRYIIYDSRDSVIAQSIGRTDESLLPELVDYIRRNYEVEKRFGETSVLRRLGSSAGS